MVFGVPFVSLLNPCECVIFVVHQTIHIRSFASLEIRATVYRAHPKEQTSTVILGSGQVAYAQYAPLPILQIILGLNRGKKLSTKTRYRHS